MKLLKLSFLSILLLTFSCSSDDDDSSTKSLKEGWTAEEINKEIEKCEGSLGPNANCKCIVEKSAEVFTLENFNREPSLTDAEISEFNKIIASCASEKPDVTAAPIIAETDRLAEGWTTDKVEESKRACDLAATLGASEAETAICKCTVDAQSKTIPFGVTQLTEEQQNALALEAAKCSQ